MEHLKAAIFLLFTLINLLIVQCLKLENLICDDNKKIDHKMEIIKLN